LPWYSHGLHTSHRHRHHGRIRLVHGAHTYGHIPSTANAHEKARDCPALAGRGGGGGGAVARAHGLTADGLSAAPGWHGASRPRCRVAASPRRAILCAVTVPSLRRGTGIALAWSGGRCALERGVAPGPMSALQPSGYPVQSIDPGLSLIEPTTTRA